METIEDSPEGWWNVWFEMYRLPTWLFNNLKLKNVQQFFKTSIPFDVCFSTFLLLFQCIPSTLFHQFKFVVIGYYVLDKVRDAF